MTTPRKAPFRAGGESQSRTGPLPQPLALPLVAESFTAGAPRLIEVPISRELPERLNYG